MKQRRKLSKTIPTPWILAWDFFNRSIDSIKINIEQTNCRISDASTATTLFNLLSISSCNDKTIPCFPEDIWRVPSYHFLSPAVSHYSFCQFCNVLYDATFTYCTSTPFRLLTRCLPRITFSSHYLKCHLWILLPLYELSHAFSRIANAPPYWASPDHDFLNYKH